MSAIRIKRLNDSKGFDLMYKSLEESLDEDRGPHGLQNHGEHLHARKGRDAEEGDGEHGGGVWEQGEMRLS